MNNITHKEKTKMKNIKLCKNTEIKIEKVRSQFRKETGEELTSEDCIKLSMEELFEEVDNYGIGRMFLRTHLWEKGVVFLNGSDGIIGSQ